MQSSRIPMWTSWFGSAIVAVLLSLFTTQLVAVAGLCGSEVIVVVNGSSLNSRTLANHYVSLRSIPASNVVVLNDVPNSEVVSIADFRQKILKPLLETINERNLAGNVKCISYSADFPTAIDISEELKPLAGKLPEFVTSKASINALTYLYQLSLSGQPDYISLDINYYARRPIEKYFSSPVGIVTEEAWSAIQKLIADTEHAKAADALEELLKSYPQQHPVAYLAAAEAAQAGDKPRAIRLLKTAIETGWVAGGYLADDKRFDSVRDDAEYQVLQFLLDAEVKTMQPTLGFESVHRWTPNGVGNVNQEAGVRYLLSTVLGVTRGLGTTLPEAIACLERAASADWTHPAGTFYFADTNDVRAKTRRDGFPNAVSELQLLGFKAEIITKTAFPTKSPAVLGVQMGTPNYDWSRSSSNFVPGAIADNLTSFGGIMNGNPKQTKLTELLKAGAAGSSGTVVEPYAMQEKFPSPNMYTYYANGSSLAEAFYQSVTGPYQLLIVGDPVCQPFSHAPQPQLDTKPRNLKDSSNFVIEISDKGVPLADWLELETPLATRKESIAAASIVILLDGRITEVLPASDKLTIRTGNIAPGYHEVRLKFAASDPLSQCSDAVIPIWKGSANLVQLKLPSGLPESKASESKSSEPAATGNQPTNAPSDKATRSAAPAKMPEVSLKSELVKLQIATEINSAATVKEVRLLHDSEIVAQAEGPSGEFTIAPVRLGMGPVRLQAVAILSDETVIQSVPKWIRVAP